VVEYTYPKQSRVAIQKVEEIIRRYKNMPKFDEFDLDVKSNKNETNGEGQTRVTSVALCTPGTCHSDCDPTAWLCSDVCITRTCITCP